MGHEIEHDHYQPMPKIGRLFRKWIATEKIDGTNAAIIIREDNTIQAASKNRLIYPGDDNFGFAAWVAAQDPTDLLKLGVGTHRGEWWGKGIQRGYGLIERRFSLFNTSRWGPGGTDPKPDCCHVVPILSDLMEEEDMRFPQEVLDSAVLRMYDREQGHTVSVAAPGWMKPEGVVLFHTQTGVMFKWTVDGDGHKESQ